VFLGLGNLGKLLDSRYSKSTKKLLLVLEDGSEDFLAGLAPDMSSVMGVFQPELAEAAGGFGPVEGVCITSACAQSGSGSQLGGERSRGRKICMRYWSPWNGLPEGEDPVNGVSHTLLASYWSEKWQVARGEEITSRVLSHRGGIVTMKVHPTQDVVVLTGETVTVSTGVLCVRMTKDIPAPAATPSAGAAAAAAVGEAGGGVVHV
jgi:hypothetical protein